MRAATSELTSLPATALAELIRSREATSVEIVEAHLRRIEAVNPAVNAVVQVDGERALTAARAADAAEPAAPLHGVPFTVKDNLETAGVVTAFGVRERASYVPERDATVVARMRATGAILLGKTNCPPWGGGSTTENELYGRTNNPYDLARTPGGSSGGEAAAIAAGMSPLGLGSDSGGSLRQPAHFCGIACLKPTAGLVPLTGLVDDDGPVGAISDPRTQIGPLARGVDDLALVLRAIAGADRLEPDVPPVELGDPARVRIERLRVAVDVANELAPPGEETLRAVAAAADALAGAGAVVEERSLPADGHSLTREIWRSYGGRLRSDELYAVLRRWDAYRRRMLAALEGHDAVLCPVFHRDAPRHEETNEREFGDGVSYTTAFSLTGWPAAVVRAGESADGLPIGVQVVARPWRDDVALAAAAAIEASLGGWRMPALP